MAATQTITPQSIKELLQTEAVDITSPDALYVTLSRIQQQNSVSQSSLTSFLSENYNEMVKTFSVAQLASEELKQITSELQDIYAKIDAPIVSIFF